MSCGELTCLPLFCRQKSAEVELDQSVLVFYNTKLPGAMKQAWISGASDLPEIRVDWPDAKSTRVAWGDGSIC